jgi:hypothetical protein
MRMIHKPRGAERESRAHVAVGRAIEIGEDVRDASRKTGRMLGVGYVYFFMAMMAFGLITSSTPIWFKAIGLALFYGAFRAVRARGRTS